MRCDICNKEIDRYHTTWLPERMSGSALVYPLCFVCTDNFIKVYNKNILTYILNRYYE